MPLHGLLVAFVITTSASSAASPRIMSQTISTSRRFAAFLSATRNLSRSSRALHHAQERGNSAAAMYRAAATLGSRWRTLCVLRGAVAVEDDEGDPTEVEANTTEVASVKLPKRLSPSSLMDFKNCPQLYRFRYIEKEEEPPSEVMVRGSMVHDALDELYDKPPSQRSERVLHDLFRATWLRQKEKYAADLFPTVERQRSFGLAALKLLSNYYQLEEPEKLQPYLREHRLFGKIEGGPNITGVLDRVDQEDEELVVVDYKTGKAPELKYSEAVNQRIIEDKFFQLKVYALLLGASKGRLPSKLKLIFLDGPTMITMRIKPEEVKEAEREVCEIWSKIMKAAETNDFAPKPSRLCDWCNFKSKCPAWNFPVEKDSDVTASPAAA